MKKFVMFLIICLAVFNAGCDQRRIVAMEIAEYPHRIVYYVGQDNQLDLSGGKVKLTHKAGTEAHYEMSENQFTIIHSIDFNTEGVYVVEIRRSQTFYSRFPVQVIRIDIDE